MYTMRFGVPCMSANDAWIKPMEIPKGIVTDRERVRGFLDLQSLSTQQKLHRRPSRAYAASARQPSPTERSRELNGEETATGGPPSPAARASSRQPPRADCSRGYADKSLPSRSSPKASEGWLGVRDDFRCWLIRAAA
jgi:hypothetical protein